MLSWEKPLVKPMASGSLSYYIASLLFTSHLVYYFAIFNFPFHKPKIPKILLYHLSIYIRSHFANNREGIDNPFITLGASWCLFVQVFGDLCVVSYWIDTLVLKTEGNTYSTLLHHPFLFKEKPTQAQEVEETTSVRQCVGNNVILPFLVLDKKTLWTHSILHVYGSICFDF